MTKPIEFTDLEQFIVSSPKWKETLSAPPFDIKIKQAYPELYSDMFMFSYPIVANFNLSIVRACRGCVYRVIEDGAKRKAIPICLPYTKFTNYGERELDDARHDWESNIATEKLDGSMVKLVKYESHNLWFLNNSYNLSCIDPQQYDTDGTLTFQILLDKALEQNKPLVDSFLSNLPEHHTFMFELVSPNHRIVCKYPETTLYFHGCRNNITCVELDAESAKTLFNVPFPTPKRVTLTTYSDVMSELAKINGHNAEGFVIIDKNFHRMKIKCEDYLKRHSIITRLTTDKAKLAFIFSGIADDYTEAIPLIQSMKDIITNGYSKFSSLSSELKEMNSTKGESETRKYILTHSKQIASIYFLALKTPDEQLKAVYDDKIKDYRFYSIIEALLNNETSK